MAAINNSRFVSMAAVNTVVSRIVSRGGAQFGEAPG